MVCLDANVVLDLLLRRQGYRMARQLVLESGEGLSISVLSVHLVVYFSRKANVGFGTIFAMVDRLKVLEMTPVDYHWAKLNMRDDDFEDALQLAVAIRNGCDTFITFDKKLHDTYKSLPQLKLQLVK